MRMDFAVAAVVAIIPGRAVTGAVLAGLTAAVAICNDIGVVGAAPTADDAVVVVVATA